MEKFFIIYVSLLFNFIEKAEKTAFCSFMFIFKRGLFGLLLKKQTNIIFI